MDEKHLVSMIDADAALHAEDAEGLERRIVSLACEQADAHDGAIFLWDAKARGLVVDFHVVDDVVVTLPGALLRPRSDGRPNGIALACWDSGRPYLCNDTAADPHYARYFLEVGSVLAVPIPWQGRSLGVLSVSAKRTAAFDGRHVDAVVRIAQAAAKHLRRAQLARATRKDTGRPFLIKGLSAAWLEVERKMEQVSATDAPVLVDGVRGSG